MLAPLFDRFVQDAPLCVAARALLERALRPADLDRLFDQTAQVQYTRELLFSSLVDLLTRVALRVQPSVRQAYRKAPSDLPVTLAAVYQKLNHLEPQLGPALVRHGAAQMNAVLDALHLGLDPWRPGYTVKILDGNHFAGTDHRLACLQGTAAAALPGQVLAVLDPQRRLFLDLIPCEDAYTQERALLDQVLPQVAAKDVWVADRNLCTPKFLLGIAARAGCFVIREHAQLHIRYQGDLKRCGRTATGDLFEQRAVVWDEASGRRVRVRRVVVRLDQPTREGETEISLLTNLPAKVAAARAVADLYRERWTIEICFGELTTALRCEVETLGYPQAALFCFAVAALAANVLGGVRGALSAVHGVAKVAAGLSFYQVAQDIQTCYAGMMVALPAADWAAWRELSLAEFVARLVAVVRHTTWAELRKTTRQPKPPPAAKPSAARHRHVSTARELQKQRSA